VIFEPDILVADAQGALVLVVETKLTSVINDDVERQLTRYMFGMRCPVGMLITSDCVRLYRDTYRERDERGIERVTEFELPSSLVVPAVLSSDKAEQGAQFERAVQRWLEDLGQGGGLDDLAIDARDALEEHVLPLLQGGHVRAGHPRWRRTGS
jgi:hypothetical protein